jgi:hypothetical protein
MWTVGTAAPFPALTWTGERLSATFPGPSPSEELFHHRGLRGMLGWIYWLWTTSSDGCGSPRQSYAGVRPIEVAHRRVARPQHRFDRDFEKSHPLPPRDRS